MARASGPLYFRSVSRRTSVSSCSISSIQQICPMSSPQFRSYQGVLRCEACLGVLGPPQHTSTGRPSEPGYWRPQHNGGYPDECTVCGGDIRTRLDDLPPSHESKNHKRTSMRCPSRSSEAIRVCSGVLGPPPSKFKGVGHPPGCDGATPAYPDGSDPSEPG